MQDDLAEDGCERHRAEGFAADTVWCSAPHPAVRHFEINVADLLDQPPIAWQLKHDHIPYFQPVELADFLDEDIITMLVSRA